jgi:cell division septal protein FtsQ
MSQLSSKYNKKIKPRDYQNPVLLKDKQKRSKRKTKFYTIAGGIIFFVGFIFIFFAPVFQFKSVEINGLNRVSQENIIGIINTYRYEKKLFIFSRNNFWIFNKSKVTELIEDQYKFENLKIKKKLFSKLVIEIVEKEPEVIWQANNICYHLDNSGLAIEYCEGDRDFIRIKDVNNNPVKIGERPLEQAELSYYIDLNNKIWQYFGKDFAPSLFELEYNTIKVLTNRGFYILFNKNLGVDAQVARLQFLLNNDNMKHQLDSIQYFDLRFGEKIFYK